MPTDNLTFQLKRILVVDDDPDIRQLLQIKLIDAGFEVWSAANGKRALEVIDKNGIPHLALVDINMPEMGGMQFCRTLHQFSDVPVVMLTAVDDTDVVVSSIQEHAEDYIVKPFNLNELVARIERVLRRFPDYGYTQLASTVVNGDVQVNFSKQMLLSGDQRLSMTPTETKLLHILMANSGRTVSNEFLLSRLWPREEIFEDTLRVHMHRLRRKLHTLDPERDYIETHRGIGYRFGDQGEHRSRRKSRLADSKP